MSILNQVVVTEKSVFVGYSVNKFPYTRRAVLLTSHGRCDHFCAVLWKWYYHKTN